MKDTFIGKELNEEELGFAFEEAITISEKKFQEEWKYTDFNKFQILEFWKAAQKEKSCL